MAAGNKGKPPGQKPPTGKVEGPGRVGVDDRGNKAWEWAPDDNLQAEDSVGTAERVRALVDPSLTVVDDDRTEDPIRSNPKGQNRGYNPYNSGALGKQGWKKKKNLKELSKWIELRKKVKDNSSEK